MEIEVRRSSRRKTQDIALSWWGADEPLVQAGRGEFGCNLELPGRKVSTQAWERVPLPLGSTQTSTPENRWQAAGLAG